MSAAESKDWREERSDPIETFGAAGQNRARLYSRTDTSSLKADMNYSSRRTFLTALTNSRSLRLGIFRPFEDNDRKNERLRPLLNSI